MPSPTKPVVPDLLAAGLKLVFCGTAPSRASKEAQAYYAKPGNRFWKTLFEAGLTPHQFAPRDYPDLLKYKIGLTDLNKREWGIDAQLSPGGFDIPGFTEKMRKFQPRIIAFTSKNAAASYLGRGTGTFAYGLQEEKLGESRLFVLPSTSGLATSYFDIAPWRELALLVSA